jgi:hypothetical protein
MITTELMPADGHKSFYGKAKVITDNQNICSKLMSYDTIVAEYNHIERKLTINGWYSATTARHINAFIQGLGFEAMTKKEMLNHK